MPSRLRQLRYSEWYAQSAFAGRPHPGDEILMDGEADKAKPFRRPAASAAVIRILLRIHLPMQDSTPSTPCRAPRLDHRFPGASAPENANVGIKWKMPSFITILPLLS